MKQVWVWMMSLVLFACVAAPSQVMAFAAGSSPGTPQKKKPVLLTKTKNFLKKIKRTDLIRAFNAAKKDKQKFQILKTINKVIKAAKKKLRLQKKIAKLVAKLNKLKAAAKNAKGKTKDKLNRQITKLGKQLSQLKSALARL